jgi:hypothetical protein
MRRALALLAAAGMIAAAVFIRSRIDEDTTTVASVSSNAPPTGPITIACVTELRDACDAIMKQHPEITIRVEDAATTAQALAKEAGGIDGWLTLEPWPDIVNELAQNPIFKSETSIASTPLVIAMVKQRANVLASNCPNGVVGWKCLGDRVGKPWTDLTGGVPAWGNVTVGNPPLTSATGLLLFGNAATGYFGRTNISTNDFDDPSFMAWRTKLKMTFMDVDPFGEFVTQLPAKFSGVGVTSAEEKGNVGTKADQVMVVNPTPPASAVVTLAPVGTGSRADEVSRVANSASLQDTLRFEGWSVGDIPKDTGLPTPGVLLALSGLSG